MVAPLLLITDALEARALARTARSCKLQLQLVVTISLKYYTAGRLSGQRSV